MNLPTNRIACTLFCASIAILSACNALPESPAVPAVIVDADDNSRAELQQAVANMLNNSAVILANDALTTNSLLIIERKQLLGREISEPEQFRLWLDGNICLLEHQGTGEQQSLLGTRCRPEG
jgi:hypothetical protein